MRITSSTPLHLLFLLLPLFFALPAVVNGFGSMGPISAAFGENGFFCAIDASGRQNVICWGKNSSSSSSSSPSSLSSPSSPFSDAIPPMAALSGGEGFLCGILANTSQAYCWSYSDPTANLVPSVYQSTAYSHVAAGKSHACAVRGSYYSDQDSGTVDCWEIVRASNRTLSSVQSGLFYDQSINNLVFRKVVAGEGFSCGDVREGDIVCWGPTSAGLGLSGVSDRFQVLASGTGSLCGILEDSAEIRCWGDNSSFNEPPVRARFISLTAGARHFCGIREDTHEVECWGSYNSSLLPKGSGFMAIASSDFTICGTREGDLVLDCWYSNASSSVPDYNPPLELSSPGLCIPRLCGSGEFAFNASILNEAGLTSLCVRKELQICSPCGLNCSEGYFLSSECTANSDRICTSCSLCQNSSCTNICGLPPPQEMKQRRFRQIHQFFLIIGCSVSGFLFILLCGCLLPRMMASLNTAKEKKTVFGSCIGKKEPKTEPDGDFLHPPLVSTPSIGSAQVFRLLELKDATNGFKEFNELGRGSYGFVYKAVLSDGRQVAVKRANAATIIHTNSREFEMELEILCKVRHPNIVNLLGYCSEMGERLLVYELMSHGTLHDHLHGGLSPLNWVLRLRIAMQAAKGLEYLHREAVPPIVHRDVKSSNILLDADWGARIADFGLLTPSERDLGEDMKGDVYNFGIVLLEILSGRKSYEIDFMPPNIVEWAVPLIKKGKGAAIIDRYVALPRNVEPLLKLADMAELALREDPNERPTMSEIASWLEQIVKDGLIL
ncbi:serine/threonine-protein kinase-like protein CCR1 [Punica granatum]|uniref:non-specific serine/threonine protein kinase n=1 Tax=Punica granatum TaxID=22663 RepID=A0A218XD20_PUNGR|nr:serine/threonine-protein kinase-like protein CCR1 [Punica granatum]OWM82401.1 hypothetical protein CDL15_Pgr001975 [Punica granatum]